MTSPGPHDSEPTAQPDAAAYRERLLPGPLGWALVVGFAGLVLIALFPVRPWIAIAVGGAALVVALVVALRTSPRVTVAHGVLTAGRAHIPVHLLGRGRTLDTDGVRAALGPGSDARTYVCLRAWIPGGVEVAVEDPADPTPAWLISTRRPDALLAAIERAQDQAAHSEQIS